MRFDPEAWSLDRPSLGSLDSILVRPAKSLPSCLVVMCHGFGAPGSDLVGLFEDILYYLPEDASKPAFLFPEAPIDLEDEGMFGARAWWRINMAKLMQMSATNSFEEVRNSVPDGIDEAREKLCNCIDACREQQKWGDLPIVLGGFSQGAMLTVDTALRGTVSPVIGLLVFSGALICESLWRNAAAERPLHVPVVQSHGTVDQVLPIATGRWLHSLLNEIGCAGELAEFHGPHTIPTDALEAAAKLLNKLLPPT
ncbi:MAG: lysophospholipase [Planctomycetota bacterium]|nr:lysophospholipase [Planctomycetota bacterium]